MNMKSSIRTFANSLLAAALVFALALPAVAQAPGQDKSVSVGKVEKKGKAPVSKEILRVKLPKPFEATLENGLTVMILEDRRFPTVNVSLNISGAGGLYEPADSPGLAVMTASLLREGTTSRSSKQLAEDIERLGAAVNASSALGSAASQVTASGLSDNMGEWMALMLDVLLNPSFPTDELAKLKDRQKASLRQARTQPFALANERFSKAIFRDHPASRTLLTNAAIDAMTSEKLAAWHKERYAPQNAILGIAGDVSAAELMPKLKAWFAPWQKSDLKEKLPPNPVPATAKKIYLVDRPNSVQTNITMGNLAIDRRDPEYPAMVVMNRIIGDGPAARLFINLREEKGYTYGVYSAYSALKYPGPWSASGDYRTEVTEGAMTEMLKEVNRLREEAVPDAELEDAKRAIVAGFALSLEQPTTLLNYAIVRKIYRLPADYWDTYPAKIAAITADDVQYTAVKYLNPEAMQVVAVGDGSKIKAVLDKFGPVEVFDTEGKPVAAKPAPASPGN
jgi:predicted Zn-dependent peptidase